MINYRKFKLPGNATLRVRAENIVATVSAQGKNTVDIYVAGIATPFHVPIMEEDTPRDLMNYIWEREHIEDREED